jgi:hypothetical protein
MNKSTIAIGSIIIFLVLVLRTLYTHIDGVKNEKLSYVHKLNFKFSTKIDSVQLLNQRNSGLIFFHGAPVTFREFEDKLQDQLKYNGDLRFILFRPNNVLAIATGMADKYKTGDSIVVDTDNNTITFYRGNKMISESEVTEALNGRPF